MSEIKYMDIKKWVATFGYFSEWGIRHLIHTNEVFNDLVVKRVGRKILLDIKAMDKFVSQNGKEKKSPRKRRLSQNKKDTNIIL